ncbi:Flp family type IVb pilin [Anaerobacillus alkalilacustris]|uniref:Flp family type IVb pilin n=1 Tax=Anaerobacillus alkalilacustris TaxID=393763 RepID=UPI000A62A321|nr:Flp family type IVb pilin [Anaerobacillus alkalilacustris]
MLNKFMKFFKEEEGQGMTEYGLILGVIAIGAIAAFTLFGDSLIEKINEVRGSIFSTE